MRDPLEALAARAEGDPYFLACPLAAYARHERLEDAGLAAALGCRAEDLTRVRLCRTPGTEDTDFWDDVSRIAERFGMDPERLADAIKRGRILLRWQAGPPPAGGFLMAARDHDEPPPEEPEGPA
jgi:hypothetical protein